MRVGGKAKPSVFLGNDHPKEFACLQKIPDARRQVPELPVDLPLIEHAAELLDRAVEEGLLLLRELRLRECEQLCPIGITAEQVGIPPNVAGFDRFALSRRQARQNALCPPK